MKAADNLRPIQSMQKSRARKMDISQAGNQRTQEGPQTILSEGNPVTKRNSGFAGILSPTSNIIGQHHQTAFSEMAKLPVTGNPLSPKFGGSESRGNEQDIETPEVLAQSRQYEYMSTRLQSRREISIKGISEPD